VSTTYERLKKLVVEQLGVEEDEVDVSERRAGLVTPFVCEQGVCGTCMARRVQGEVALRENHVLSDHDLASGYTLACQGVPCSAVCEIEVDG